MGEGVPVTGNGHGRVTEPMLDIGYWNADANHRLFEVSRNCRFNFFKIGNIKGAGTYSEVSTKSSTTNYWNADANHRLFEVSRFCCFNFMRIGNIKGAD